MPRHISAEKGPLLPLPSLRLMIPPLRLVSAAIWETIRHRHVMDYGVLEEFVTMVTTLVPEILDPRQRAQLILGLQARDEIRLLHHGKDANKELATKLQLLVLELCRSKPMAGIQTIHTHLERIQTLTCPWGTQTSEGELSGSNFLMLIESLLEDPEEMEQFFQKIFPVEFGAEYDAKIENLMWQFLSRLEELLPVSNFQQVASLLGDVPSVLEECVESVSDPQHLKTLIQYHRDLGQLDSYDTQSSFERDCILSAVCLSQVNRVRCTAKQPDNKKTEEMADPAEHEDMDVHATNEEQNVLGVGEQNVLGVGEQNVLGVGEQNVLGVGEQNVLGVGEQNVLGDGEQNVLGVGEKNVLGVGEQNVLGDGEQNVLGDGEQNVLGDGEQNVLGDGTAGEGMDVLVEEVDPRNETVIGFIREDGVLMPCKGLGVKNTYFKKPQICVPDVKSTVHFQPLVNLQRPDGKIQTLRPARRNTGNETKTLKAQEQKQTKGCEQMPSCTFETSRCLKSFHQNDVYNCSYCTRTYKYLNNMRVHEETCLIERGQTEKVPFGESCSPAMALSVTDISGCTQQRPPLVGEDKESSRVNQKDSCEAEISKSLDVSNPQSWFAVNTTFYQTDNILPDHTTVEESPQNHQDFQRLKKLKCEEDSKESQCRSPGGTEMDPEMSSIMCPEPSSNPQNISNNPASQPEPSRNQTHLQTTVDCKPHLPKSISMKSHIDLRPHMCPYCQKKFTFKRALKTHQLTHNPLFCTLCRMKFADPEKLDRHKLVAHKSLKCTMCEEDFNWIKHLSKHYLNVHQFIGPFPCNYCQKSFATLSARVTHERTHTGDLPYQCSHCPKKYNKSADLVEHCKIHTGEKPCLCWECGQGFTNEIKLRNHMLNVHSKPQHFCSQCDKSYGEKRTLVSHVKTCHVGIRYPCTGCAKTFTSMSSLTIHERIHSQQKPFKCTQLECGKDFRSKKELTVHMRYHTGERPFSCQVCGKGFTQSCYLTQHMRTHTGEKPFPCPICGRSFNDSRKLKRHTMTHTKVKPYQCLRCDKAFCRPDLLKAHDGKEH